MITHVRQLTGPSPPTRSASLSSAGPPARSVDQQHPGSIPFIGPRHPRRGTASRRAPANQSRPGLRSPGPRVDPVSTRRPDPPQRDTCLRRPPHAPCATMAAFEQTFRIYYRDTDATGVVFHPNYLAFAERGRRGPGGAGPPPRAAAPPRSCRQAPALPPPALGPRGGGPPRPRVAPPVKALTHEFGLHFLVHRARLDYLRPLRLDDIVTMRTGTHRLAPASCYIRHEFTHEGRLTTRADIDLVCVRASDGRPSRIPERWRAALLQLSYETT